MRSATRLRKLLAFALTCPASHRPLSYESSGGPGRKYRKAYASQRGIAASNFTEPQCYGRAGARLTDAQRTRLPPSVPQDLLLSLSLPAPHFAFCLPCTCTTGAA